MAKLFLNDIDRVILKIIRYENHWILNYRIFIVILFLTILWYYLGNIRFWKNFTYFIFFPLIIFFWKIPKLFLWKIPKKIHAGKKWILMYAYINSWINNIYFLRRNLTIFCLLILSIAIIYNSELTALLIISILTFLSILILHLIERFKLAFSPIRIFRINLEFLTAKKAKRNEFIDKTISSYNQTIEKEKDNKDKVEQKSIQTMETLVLSHKFFDFISSRLLEFKNIRLYMAISVVKIIYTFLFSIFIISLINYTLYLINPNNFILSSSVNFFDFLYYSFHSTLLNSVGSVVPISIWAKFLNMLAPFIGLLVTIFLVIIYFSANSERYRENIDEVIAYSKAVIFDLEVALRNTFKKEVIEALVTLKLAKNSLVNILSEANFFNEISEIADKQLTNSSDPPVTDTIDDKNLETKQ